MDHGMVRMGLGSCPVRSQHMVLFNLAGLDKAFWSRFAALSGGMASNGARNGVEWSLDLARFAASTRCSSLWRALEEPFWSRFAALSGGIASNDERNGVQWSTEWHELSLDIALFTASTWFSSLWQALEEPVCSRFAPLTGRIASNDERNGVEWSSGFAASTWKLRVLLALAGFGGCLEPFCSSLWRNGV